VLCRVHIECTSVTNTDCRLRAELLTNAVNQAASLETTRNTTENQGEFVSQKSNIRFINRPNKPNHLPVIVEIRQTTLGLLSSQTTYDVIRSLL